MSSRGVPKAPRGAKQFKWTPLELTRAVAWGDEHLHPVTGREFLQNFVRERDCPPTFQSDFGSLIPPVTHLDTHKDWLNDTVLDVMTKYIQVDMSDADLTNQAAAVHPDV